MTTTVERLAERCPDCDDPLYRVKGRRVAVCASCNTGRLMVTPRRWTRIAWQIVALLSAATLVLALAAIGLALPPRVMLAIGIAAGLAVALYGVWIMAGAIYDERKP